MLINKMYFIDSNSGLSDLRYFSTAVNEFPIKRGAKSEKILAMTVIKNPSKSFVRYL